MDKMIHEEKLRNIFSFQKLRKLIMVGYLKYYFFCILKGYSKKKSIVSLLNVKQLNIYKHFKSDYPYI